MDFLQSKIKKLLTNSKCYRIDNKDIKRWGITGKCFCCTYFLIITQKYLPWVSYIVVSIRNSVNHDQLK